MKKDSGIRRTLPAKDMGFSAVSEQRGNKKAHEALHRKAAWDSVPKLANPWDARKR